MTATDKEKIRYLRGSGHGYKAIAAQLNLSAAAVKGFCHRNGVAAVSGDACPQCGAALGERRPGAEKKKFCSDSCRNKWWDSHADVRAKDKDRRVCVHCNGVFYSRKPKKYCNTGCYVTARFGGQHHDARTV